MLKEIKFSFLIKFIGIFSTILFAYVIQIMSEEQLKLLYWVGLFNLLRMIDFSLPYINRQLSFKGLKLKKLHEIVANIILSLVAFFILLHYTNQSIFFIIFFVILARFHSFLSYKLNIKQMSYLFNIPMYGGVYVCSVLVLLEFTWELIYIYFGFFSIICVPIFLIAKKQQNFHEVQIQNIINWNYLLHFLNTLIFAIYSEFHSVFAYGWIEAESYADINSLIRVSLLCISGVGIITLANWNQYGQKLSYFDEKINISIPFFGILTLIYAVLSISLETKLWFSNLYCQFIFYLILCIFNFIQSQILVRFERTFVLLCLTILETGIAIYAYKNFVSVELLFAVLNISQIVKLIAQGIGVRNVFNNHSS